MWLGLPAPTSGATTAGLRRSQASAIWARLTPQFAATSASAATSARFDPSDVLLLMSFLWRTADDAEGRAQASRTLDLVLAGLSVTAD